MFVHRRKIIAFFFSLLILLAPAAVLALDLGLGAASGLGLGSASPKVIIVNIIRIVLGFLALLAVIMFLYGGFVWMASGGAPDKVNKAKKILTSAVIGLLIILASFGIASYLLNVFQSATTACHDGDTRPCGCGGLGSQTCADQSWGACVGDCDYSAGQSCCHDLTSGWYCFDGPCPGAASSFFIANTAPADGASNVIRNAVIRFTFNAAVDAGSVNETTFSVSSTTAAIAGTRAVSGRRIEFRPAAACPPNSCSASHCLPENTAITVTAQAGAAGILSVAGLQLSCSPASPCSISFNTGTAIDCQDPTVSLDFGQVCAASAIPINASASDDSGIDRIEFYVGGSLVDSQVNPAADSPFNITGTWNAGGYTPNTQVTIRVIAYDIDDHQASDQAQATLRPEHCCNGELDGAGDPDLVNSNLPETGVDCGGECAACQGSACGTSLADDCAANSLDCHNNDDRCASRFCDCGGSSADCSAAGYAAGVNNCCLCQNAPVIYWLSPVGNFCQANPDVFCQTDADCEALTPGDTCNLTTANAAPGNFVTIGGRNFGSTAGTVEFSSGSGWVEAYLANDAAHGGNANCGSSVWQDNQIIVIMPSGVDSNPIIRVTESANGFYDTTGADSRGPLIDFMVNNIDRPGLCLLNPDTAHSQETIAYEGIKLNGALAWFGDLSQHLSALSSHFAAPANGTAQVPNLRPGPTTSYVTAANVPSNFLNFTKLSEQPAGPQIISFDPTSGAVGQYLTIRGTGFGRRRGLSKVFFIDANNNSNQFEANYDFPDVCQDSVWSDKQVIVKVPAGIGLGQPYLIAMSIQGFSQMIDTASLTPSTFFASATAVLAPSLCKISPTAGPTNAKIKLWGEYFETFDHYGPGTSRVRFYLNHDQAAGQISFWGNDPDSEAEKIITLVHPEAVTGPVRAVKGSASGDEIVGNGLNFRVGVCSQNSDCDDYNSATDDICCPVGSLAAGQCVHNEDDCYTAGARAVYEWDFSTSPGTSTPETCAGFTTARACADAGLCPNSPGQCQTRDNPVVGQCGSDYCAQAHPEAGGCCYYATSTNSCVLTGYTCDQTSTAVLAGQTAYCRRVGDVGVWQVNSQGLSCPDGTFLDLNGQCTVGQPALPQMCALCYNGSHCQDGVCVFGGPVCPPHSHCQAGQCLADNDTCECCCRVDNSAQDCCAGLSCTPGNCGNSPAGCDPGNDNCQWGLCTGCRVELDGDSDTVTGQEQIASDQACDCFGKHNRYCAITDTYPDGVCLDKHPCDSNLHQPGCQADSGQCPPGQVCNPGDCYCQPAQPCDSNLDNFICDPDNTECSPVSGYIRQCNYPQCLCDYITCGPLVSGSCTNEDNCPSGSHCDITAGCLCRADIEPPGENCYDEASYSCDESQCGFSCLQADGSPGEISTDCGVCCCDPSAAPDQCQQVNPDLSCYPNISPCDSPTNARGLCCGCKDDSDCSGFAGSGCGNDTCCHPRPQVASTIPADETDNICRNPLIQIAFNQEMNPASLVGNIILLGDYGSQVCPQGTQFLTLNSLNQAASQSFSSPRPDNFFLSLLEPFISAAWAYTPVDASHHYCAIPGVVRGYNKIGQGIAEFRPQRALDPNRLHYVIVKGGAAGVRNRFDVAMVAGSTETFNATVYADSYIFSFTTSDEICALAHVKITPANYLFQTDQDDVNIGAATSTCPHDDIGDNDQTGNLITAASVCFDALNDKDKAFYAYSLSAANQLISPLPGIYNWAWAWRSENNSVATVAALADPQTALVTAQPIKDGRTYVWARAQISEDNVFSPPTVGRQVQGRARVFVFVCENPWPPRDPVSGQWQPWVDNDSNCNLVLGGCSSQNFETYYCRDEGRSGSYDDLPAILNQAIIRGSSTQKNIKKEYFFFRETLPATTSAITVQPQPEGGRVYVSWGSAVPGVAGYKIYYGTRSKNYTKVQKVANPAASGALVSGLTNGTTYYFAVSTYYDTGAESELSAEASAVPADTQPPAAPSNLTATAASGQVQLNWSAVDEAVAYRVYYGLNSGDYGGTSDVGNATSALVTGLTNGTAYYFTVTAIDQAGNESAYAAEVSAVPGP